MLSTFFCLNWASTRFVQPAGSIIPRFNSMIFRTEGIPEGKSHVTVAAPPRLLSGSAIRKDVCLPGLGGRCHQPFATAVRAVHHTLRAVPEGTPPEKIETAASDELVKRFTRDDDYSRWMRDWL